MKMVKIAAWLLAYATATSAMTIRKAASAPSEFLQTEWGSLDGMEEHLLALVKDGNTPALGAFVKMMQELVVNNIKPQIQKHYLEEQTRLDRAAASFDSCAGGLKDGLRTSSTLLADARTRGRSYKNCTAEESADKVDLKECATLLKIYNQTMMSTCQQASRYVQGAVKKTARAQCALPEGGLKAARIAAGNLEKFYANFLSKSAELSGRCGKTLNKLNKQAAYCRGEKDEALLDSARCRNLKLQAKVASCRHSRSSLRTCGEYKTCVVKASKLFDDARTSARKVEEGLKTEWHAILRLECLTGVLGLSDSEKEQGIKACREKDYSKEIDTMSLKFPSTPKQEQCNAEREEGCDDLAVSVKAGQLPPLKKKGNSTHNDAGEITEKRVEARDAKRADPSESKAVRAKTYRTTTTTTTTPEDAGDLPLAPTTSTTTGAQTTTTFTTTRSTTTTTTRYVWRPSYRQCEVQSGNFGKALRQAIEPKALTLSNGMVVNGNDGVRKASGGDAWSTGFVMEIPIAENEGSCVSGVSFQPAETNKHLMVGLSNKRRGSVSYEAIDWAAYCVAGGSFQVYERGSFAGTYGTYDGEDTVSVVVNLQGLVEYRVNEEVRYTSRNAPTKWPLYVRGSIHTMNSVVFNLRWVGASRQIQQDLLGTVQFTRFTGITSDGGRYTKPATVSDNWNAGMVSIEAVTVDSPVRGVAFVPKQLDKHLMLGLSASENAPDSYTQIQFAAYAVAGGSFQVYEAGGFRGTFGLYSSSSEIKVVVNQRQQVEYWVGKDLRYTSKTAPDFPLYVAANFHTRNSLVDKVMWVNVANRTAMALDMPMEFTTFSGVTATGPGSLRKLNTVSADWNAGARSLNTMRKGMSGKIRGVSFRPEQANSHLMFGLSRLSNGESYGEIQFAAYCVADSSFQIYESGSFKGTYGFYQAGDEVQVTVNELDEVEYRVKGEIRYTSRVQPSEELLVDTSFHTPNSHVSKVKWIGQEPRLAMRAGGPVEFRRYTGVAGARAGELRKLETQKNDWDAGAYSMHSFKKGGEEGIRGVRFQCAQVDKHLMAGLSMASRSESYTEIMYAAYCVAGGSFQVYESGSFMGTYGTYNSGDDIEVIISDTDEVEYRVAKELRYTSKRMPPKTSFIVDVSFHTVNAVLSNVRWNAGYRDEAIPLQVGKPVQFTKLQALVSNTPGELLRMTTVASEWNAYARSRLRIEKDTKDVKGVAFTPRQTNLHLMLGLVVGTTPPQSYTGINFAAYAVAGGSFQVYESGSFQGTYGTYQAESQLAVVLNARKEIEYWVGKELRFTSRTVPSFPLTVGANFHTVNADVYGIHWSADRYERPERRVGAPVGFAGFRGVTSTGPGKLRKLNTVSSDWNAGATSWSSFDEDSNVKGVRFQPDQVDRHLMVGLSRASRSESYAEIQFAAYCVAGGSFQVYESGRFMGTYGVYSPGDWIEISVNFKGQVQYLVNDEIRYTSKQVPSYPLLVDTSFHTVDGSISSMSWVGLTQAQRVPMRLGGEVQFGHFSGLASSKAGSLRKLDSMTSDWNAGASSMDSFIRSSTVRGISFAPRQVSHHLMLGLQNVPTAPGSYSNIPFAAYCVAGGSFQVYENGAFQGAFGSYDALDPIQVVLNERDAVEYWVKGEIRYTSRQNIKFPMFAGANFHTVHAAVQGAVWTSLEKRTSMKLRGLVEFDMFRGVSATGPGELKKIDSRNEWISGAVSWHSFDDGADIRGVSFKALQTDRHVMIGLSRASNSECYAEIDFAAYLVAGGSFQVYENGAFRGTFGHYRRGDTITVSLNTRNEVEYRVGREIRYTSRARPSFPLFVDSSFHTVGSSVSDITWSPAPPARAEAAPGAAVEFTNYRGVVTSGPGQIRKLSTFSSDWNAGALSWHSFQRNDQRGLKGVKFTPDQTDRHFMIGLTSRSPSEVYTDIQFAAYCVAGGSFQVYESGTFRGSFGGYNAGSTIEVAVNRQGQVEYKMDGEVKFRSSVAPSYPLFVDMSFHTQDATASNIVWV